jgi:hypothetical protein
MASSVPEQLSPEAPVFLTIGYPRPKRRRYRIFHSGMGFLYESPENTYVMPQVRLRFQTSCDPDSKERLNLSELPCGILPEMAKGRAKTCRATA